MCHSLNMPFDTRTPMAVCERVSAQNNIFICSNDLIGILFMFRCVRRTVDVRQENRILYIIACCGGGAQSHDDDDDDDTRHIMLMHIINSFCFCLCAVPT